MKKSEMIAELVWLFNWELREFIRTIKEEDDYVVIRISQGRLIGIFNALKAVRIIDNIEKADFYLKIILSRDIEKLVTLEISLSEILE